MRCREAQEERAYGTADEILCRTLCEVPRVVVRLKALNRGAATRGYRGRRPNQESLRAAEHCVGVSRVSRHQKCE